MKIICLLFLIAVVSTAIFAQEINFDPDIEAGKKIFFSTAYNSNLYFTSFGLFQ